MILGVEISTLGEEENGFCKSGYMDIFHPLHWKLDHSRIKISPLQASSGLYLDLNLAEDHRCFVVWIGAGWHVSLFSRPPSDSGRSIQGFLVHSAPQNSSRLSTFPGKWPLAGCVKLSTTSNQPTPNPTSQPHTISFSNSSLKFLTLHKFTLLQLNIAAVPGWPNHIAAPTNSHLLNMRPPRKQSSFTIAKPSQQLSMSMSDASPIPGMRLFRNPGSGSGSDLCTGTATGTGISY